MRIFGSDRIAGLMQRLGMEEGVPIEHGMVTKAIERAQKQVEAQNFATRKHLLEYDDVMNKQRESVYSLRRELLEGKIKLKDEDDAVDTRAYLMTLAEDLVDGLVDTHAGKDTNPEEWDLGALRRSVSDLFGIEPQALEGITLESMTPGRDVRGPARRSSSRSTTRRKSSASSRRSCAASSATSCCRSSTRSGRTTSTASTT